MGDTCIKNICKNPALGFPSDSDDKQSVCKCRPGFSPWIRKTPWRKNGNPLQYSCLEESMDRGAWQVAVYGVTKSQTWLSN